MKIKDNNSVFYTLAFLLIAFDQIIKISVKGFSLFGFNHQGFYYGEQVPVIGTFLQWTFIENPGMAFGIQFGWGKIFLSLFSILAGIALFFIIKKIKDSNVFVRLGFTLIFAGAVGNLIDRVFYGVFYGESALFYGKVVDFIQVDIPDISFLGWTHFPVFNIADSCVTIGVILLILFHSKLPDFEKMFKRKQNEPIIESEQEVTLIQNSNEIVKGSMDDDNTK